MIYFKRDFDYTNDVIYTFNDFINEIGVRKTLYGVKDESNNNDEVPVIVHITIRWLSKKDDGTFLLKSEHVILTIQSMIEQETKKKYRMYSAESIENHVKALLDFIKPGDMISSIEISDGK